MAWEGLRGEGAHHVVRGGALRAEFVEIGCEIAVQIIPAEAVERYE